MEYRNYKYGLKKYKGPATRHTCPQCGDPHSFSRYVDNETGEEINEIVGHCNHEQSCGYHYTPAEFFKDHPEARKGDTFKPAIRYQTPRQVVIPPKPSFVEHSTVAPTIDKNCVSDFAKWLCKYFRPCDVSNALQLYLVGRTRAGFTVYWQVDKDNNVRTGKMMQYDPNTGHRVKGKDPQKKIKQDAVFVHTMEEYVGEDKKKNWVLSQCLFGEHFLTINEKEKGKTIICIVEAEKTAVICSLALPQISHSKTLWLSCGGSKGFSEDKMKALSGWNVILFPDKGEYEAWKKKEAKLLSKYAKTVTVSKFIEEDETLMPNDDIADVIIKELENDPKESALRKMQEDNPAVTDLLREFDCEIV